MQDPQVRGVHLEAVGHRDLQVDVAKELAPVVVPALLLNQFGE